LRRRTKWHRFFDSSNMQQWICRRLCDMVVTLVSKHQSHKIQTGLVNSARSFGDHHCKVHVNTTVIVTTVTGRMITQSVVRLDLLVLKAVFLKVTPPHQHLGDEVTTVLFATFPVHSIRLMQRKVLPVCRRPSVLDAYLGSLACDSPATFSIMIPTWRHLDKSKN
jgi:hypothetical protein